MPAASAVSTTPLPFGTCTSVPSTVTVTSSGALMRLPRHVGLTKGHGR